MESSNSHRAAYVIRDEKVAMLLVDPMRRTILSVLADNAYTQSQMASIVGLTDASIGHHLHILLDAKLIRIVRREEEMHGIMQNFYRSVALCIVVDTSRMTRSVSKYFFPINIERVRGALAAVRMEKRGERSKVHSSPDLSVWDTVGLEKIAEDLAASIASEARKFGSGRTSLDRESITLKIYERALQRTLRNHIEILS